MESTIHANFGGGGGAGGVSVGVLWTGGTAPEVDEVTLDSITFEKKGDGGKAGDGGDGKTGSRPSPPGDSPTKPGVDGVAQNIWPEITP
jgi:hypothetical protein